MWEDLPHTLLQFKTSTGLGEGPRTLTQMREDVNMLISPVTMGRGSGGNSLH